MTVQSIGPYIATAIAATVGDPRNFASGRHFAAWLGLTPKQHSTGGKEKLGGISKRGDSYIRRLLIHGARATVARVRSGQMKNAWLSGLLRIDDCSVSQQNCSIVLFTSGTTADQPVQRTLFFYQRLIKALSAPYVLGTLLAHHSPT
jgi:transposase